MQPLADKIRPTSLEEVFGQEHILGKGKILNKIINSGFIPNMIFYGPPGVGKTTVANIAAKKSNKKFYKLNATNASVKDIKDIVDDIGTLLTHNGVLLYLDEIQNFNKKQQQSLLEFIENGQITLIASTTENPYHYIYKAILSRSSVFEFKSLNENEIKRAVLRAVEILNKEEVNKTIFNEEAVTYISKICGGDVRRALNVVELCAGSAELDENGNKYVDLERVMECSQIKILNYDKDGDSHYDILSAFQKSIRGSDVDASLHYLARLIKAGDLISICRRLLVIASEDIGLAYPNAIVITKNCVDSAMQLGFPEARIPLAQAVITLATSPKSNSVISAIDKALLDLEEKNIGDIPLYLKDSHYSGAEKLGRGIGYKYPHDYPNNYVKQQYLPDNIKDVIYYFPGKNKMEEKIQLYIRGLKNEIK